MIPTKLWSMSRFAEKVRSAFGIEPKPYSATMDDWMCYEHKYKWNVVYRLLETLDDVQDMLWFPVRTWFRIKGFCTRWMNKTHVMQTGLTRGGYYDIDVKMACGLIHEFMQFVEGEAAYEMALIDGDCYKCMSEIERLDAGIRWFERRATYVGDDIESYMILMSLADTAKWVTWKVKHQGDACGWIDDDDVEGHLMKILCGRHFLWT